MSEALELAKHYFELSNKGRLEEIGKLFTSSSTYSSAFTWVYLGAEQIMKMQSDFFSGFKSMAWKIHSEQEIRPGVILFDFTFSGETLAGETICRPGLEYVIIFNGKLQHVEVRNKE